MNQAQRIAVLIHCGLPPQDAANIVTQKEDAGVPDDAYQSGILSPSAGILHAATFLRYSILVDEQFKGLWDSANSPQS